MQNTVQRFCCTILTALVVCVAATAEDDTASEKPASVAKYVWSELIQPPPTTADQQERDSFAHFADALSNHSFSEAEIAAKQMVELANADVPSTRTRALHNLAVAQQFQGSHDSAIQNYSAALKVIARNEDNLSPALILSLRGLAIAHLDTGQTFEAFETFDRALHVSNVNYGPHSLKQLPILNSKMQAYLDHNDPGSALDLLDRIDMLYSRKYARHSLELLPALYQQAQLYAKLDLHTDEYRAWRDILIIKKKHYAENAPELIEPNLRLAEIHSRDLRSVGYRSVTTSDAEKHLKKALWIAENSPEDNWEVRKDCLLSIADFYTRFDLKGRAHRYYAAAWELMSSNEAYLAVRAKNLEVPVPLSQPEPDPYANFEYKPNRRKIRPDDYLDGEITVEFSVNERGRTRDLRIVAADPPNFSHMEKRVRNAVEEFVYRPRHVDGQAVATSNQQYQVSYFYLLSEYRASIEKSAGRVRPGRSKKH